MAKILNLPRSKKYKYTGMKCIRYIRCSEIFCAVKSWGLHNKPCPKSFLHFWGGKGGRVSIAKWSEMGELWSKIGLFQGKWSEYGPIYHLKVLPRASKQQFDWKLSATVRMFWGTVCQRDSKCNNSLMFEARFTPEPCYTVAFQNTAHSSRLLATPSCTNPEDPCWNGVNKLFTPTECWAQP